MGDLQEQTARASMAQPRRVRMDEPGVQVAQEPVGDRCATCRERRPANGTDVCWRCEQLNALKPQPARVDDVIAHGEAIPANVRGVHDKDGDSWWRNTIGHWHMNPSLGASRCVDSDVCRYVDAVFWPLTVTEVDPEPQPAERSLRDQLLSMWQEYATSSDVVDDAHLVRWVNALIENLGYASRRLKRAEAPESGPVVLSLPQVPDGAVALRGNASGRRWTPTPDGWMYRHGDVPWSLVTILVDEQPDGVTVEFAPPREPRTWPKLDLVADLPAEIDVAGQGRWRLLPDAGRGQRLYRQGESLATMRDATLAELRELGEVREVLA